MTSTNGSGKISSPARHLVKEVQELEEARDKIVSLQGELVNEKTERKKLEKQLELGLSEKARAELYLQVERDEKVIALQDRLDSTRHQLKVHMDEGTHLKERARLLQDELNRMRDKYELDTEWKRLSAEIKMKEEELETLSKDIAMKKAIIAEEIKDLDGIRGKYNIELERLRDVWQVKREVVAEYNGLRKKFKDIPALPQTLVRDPDYQEDVQPKKRGFFQKIRGRGRS